MVALLLLAGSAAADTRDWKMFKSDADGFAAEFPGNVTVKQLKPDADVANAVVRWTSYGWNQGTFSARVVASLHERAVTSEAFAAGVSGGSRGLKCTTAANDNIPFPAGQASEFRGKACADGTYSIRIRYYAVGKWFYVVIAVFRGDGAVDVQDAMRFMDSFKVVSQ
jgi:hypothetical protein